MSYNEDDAWGSPHRTINTLNTTGINCRFPKVNFLWSYFLLAFKWKYCSYNLNKPRYIALNGTHMIQEKIVFTLLFLSSGQFMASKINWGCEVDPLKQILGIFFSRKREWNCIHVFRCNQTRIGTKPQTMAALVM